jgi:hypothetical protein
MRSSEVPPFRAATQLASAGLMLLAITLVMAEGTAAKAESAAVSAGTRASHNLPETCPVTKPEAQTFIPPSPYPPEAGPGEFWFGTEKLWTMLPVNGTWKGLPHYRPTDSSFRQKMFWSREGYDWHAEPYPALTVTGRRVDGPAPPFMSPPANNGYTSYSSMVVGLDISTLGCWELTGHYRNPDLTVTDLTFVILVTQ